VTRLVWRRWNARRPTGVDRVCLAYLDHFGRDALAVVQHRRIRRILDWDASQTLFDLLASEREVSRNALIRFALRNGLRGGREGAGRIYLNLGHTGLNAEGFGTWLQSSSVVPVYFVHDLIPITHPQYCRAGERTKHINRMRAVLQSGVGVIGNSQMTLDELTNFARAEQLRIPRMIKAPLGSDTLVRRDASVPQLGQATFVILGTIEARKNHLMLLNVWAKLVERLGERAPRLLVIGQRGWECDDVFDLLDRSAKLKGAVIELGRCDDETLATHLAGARALLFPSLIEGYGLPLVEALSAGLPVIASDLPVFREIAGDVPDYLDPLDAQAWERMILLYAENESAARNAQLARIAGYRAPTWADHFARVEKWLTSL
jgi:glycosyltransferase involved in cell wall biosynthesis